MTRGSRANEKIRSGKLVITIVRLGRLGGERCAGVAGEGEAGGARSRDEELCQSVSAFLSKASSQYQTNNGQDIYHGEETTKATRKHNGMTSTTTTTWGVIQRNRIWNNQHINQNQQIRTYRPSARSTHGTAVFGIRNISGTFFLCQGITRLGVRTVSGMVSTGLYHEARQEPRQDGLGSMGLFAILVIGSGFDASVAPRGSALHFSPIGRRACRRGGEIPRCDERGGNACQIHPRGADGD